MSALETLILGVVQGLTEFLPVSSSGHLELVKAIFGSDYEQQQGLLVTITLHAATAFSTIFVFRKDIALILSDLLHFKKGESLNFSMKIILSMIPAVIIGLFFEGFIASLFDGKIALVGAMLMITALLLILADRVNENGMSTTQVVGVTQLSRKPERVYMPDHPKSDEKGFVYSAAVNVEEEFVEMLEASRQYQNNIEVVTTLRALMMRTINMGK